MPECGDNNRLFSLSGLFYDKIKQLERQWGVAINWRDNSFELVGKILCIDAAVAILASLCVDKASLIGLAQISSRKKSTELSS
ncbi:MAG: hypothetical protein ACTXOO_04830 [Sodalis sp. (in: enterobacteria)]